LHAINGGVFYGLPMWLIPSLTQRVFEYEADAYASRLVDKKSIIEALNKLNEMSNGKIAKGGITHPSLEKRIDNILKS